MKSGSKLRSGCLGKPQFWQSNVVIRSAMLAIVRVFAILCLSFLMDNIDEITTQYLLKWRVTTRIQVLRWTQAHRRTQVQLHLQRKGRNWCWTSPITKLSPESWSSSKNWTIIDSSMLSAGRPHNHRNWSFWTKRWLFRHRWLANYQVINAFRARNGSASRFMESIYIQPLRDSAQPELAQAPNCCAVKVIKGRLCWIQRTSRQVLRMIQGRARNHMDNRSLQILNPKWNSFVDTVLVPRIQSELSLQNTFKAKLHKLLIYRTGSCFKAHRDSEKESNMFATLVIQLPSKYEGG